VQRDLKKLGKQEALRILNQLEAEFAGLRKFRVGDYRIIYSLMDENVVVLRIGHRREVYK
jgi:mRNA interferase RelE/StbE